MNESVTWRHAILFRGSPSGLEAARIAKELLTEWGEARGLKAGQHVTQERDYTLAHGMEFSGELVQPPAGQPRSRLQGSGAPFPEMLAGKEELVPWPVPDEWRRWRLNPESVGGAAGRAVDRPAVLGSARPLTRWRAFFASLRLILTGRRLVNSSGKPVAYRWW